MSIDFDKIKDWRQTTEETTDNQGDLPQTLAKWIVENVCLSQAKQEHNAKLAEFQEVKPIREVKDEGQDCISLYWVVKSKTIDGKSGFEEGQDF